MRKLLMFCIKKYPYLGAGVLFLIVLLSFMEGVGVLLLIPLLSLTDLAGGAVGMSFFGVRQFLAGFGITTLPVYSVILIYVVVVTVVAVLRLLKSLLSERLRNDLTFSMRQELYDALLGAQYSFLATQNPSDLSNLLGGQISRFSFAINQSLALISGLLLVIVYATLMGITSLPALLLVFGVALASAVLLLPIQRRIKKGGMRSFHASRHFTEHVLQYITSFKQVKASVNEGFASRKFLQSIQAMREEDRVSAQHFAVSKLVYDTVGIILIASIVSVSYYVLKTPVDVLILILIFCARILPRLGGMIDQYNRVLFIAPSFENIRQTLADAVAAKEGVFHGEKLAFETDIVFKEVSFSYDRGVVIDAYTARIQKGEFILVSGPSGAGKTTLIDLLVALQFPQAGAVYVDGVPLTSENSLAWRTRIAYLNQMPMLYRGTVRENLTWGLSGISDASIWEMLERVNAVDFVQGLPAGLDTPLKDFAENISGGQRQRLSLARLLLRGADVLVLDEALNHLDVQSRERFYETLLSLKGSVTIILISHDMSAAVHADHVWEIK